MWKTPWEEHIWKTHLACQALLRNKFLSTLGRRGNWLGWFYHSKNIFGSPSRRIYWKRNQTAMEVSDEIKVWLETDNYILTIKEKKILVSDTEWLNDNTMDASQRLIFKSVGRLESYQSVLDWQKRGTWFFNISEENTKCIRNGANHWLISFSSNDRVQICDSLYTNLTPVIKICSKTLSISLKLK